MEQGSPEWFQARLGKATASRICDVIAETKSGGWGASRANYMAELVAERLTGVTTETYSNAIMQRGTEVEPEARAAYAFHRDVDVVPVGFVPHPTIQMSGASPDGLIGDDGLVQIKCPNTATHIETLLSLKGKPADKYLVQMQWELACTGRAWCDFVSYDPRLPEGLRLFVKRIERDEARIATLEKLVVEFLGEVEAKVAGLRRLYSPPDPPADAKPDKPRRPFHELPAACQIALACKDPKFREWLSQNDPLADVSTEAAAEDAIKFLCGVERKRNVQVGTDAFGKWTEIYGTFTAWRDYERAA